MDVQLDQAPQHRTAISSSLQKNDLVNSVHDAIKTLASFLAFLTNVADWHPEKPEQESDKPTICKFLENIIRQLTSRAGRGWQQQFKALKHLGTTILIKVQMVVANLVQAASQTNIQNKDFDTVIAHDCFTNLAKAIQLLEYFNTDLDRAITGNVFLGKVLLME